MKIRNLAIYLTKRTETRFAGVRCVSHRSEPRLLLPFIGK